MLYSNGSGGTTKFDTSRGKMAFTITENCIGCGHCVQWCPTRAIHGKRKVSYHINKEQCIDCGVCGRICAHAAVMDPVGKPAVHIRRLSWLRPNWSMDACIQCGACLDLCPVDCIHYAAKDESSQDMVSGYPHVTRPRLCIGCGFCASACQVGAIAMRVGG